MSNGNWHAQETYKSLLTLGNNALKFVLLINGGAIIALLTFLGNLLKTNPTVINADLACSLYLYIGGILCAGVAHFTGYMTQLKLFNERNGSKKHRCWLYASMVFLISGIVLFAMGSLYVLDGLQSIQ